MKKRGSDDFPFDDLAGRRKSPWSDSVEPSDTQKDYRADQNSASNRTANSMPAQPVQQRPAPTIPLQRNQPVHNSQSQQYNAVHYDSNNRYSQESMELDNLNRSHSAPVYERQTPPPRTLNRQIQILTVISAVLLIIVLILGYFVFFPGRKSSAAAAASKSTAAVVTTASAVSGLTGSDTAAGSSESVSAAADTQNIIITPVAAVNSDPNSLINLPPSKEHPVIALTFDDGPSASLTPGLLDILKEKGVHATFFVLGQETLDADPAILQRMLAEGHEIGNHSYDHSIYTDLTADQIREQLTKTNDAVFAATGAYPTVMRPPTGGCNDTVLAISTEMNLPCVNWSWESCPEDWLKDHQTPEFISNHVITNAANGHIVLLHDIHTATVDSIAAMIDGLAAKGYRFATVSELLAAQPEGKKTGVLYYYGTFA